MPESTTSTPRVADEVTAVVLVHNGSATLSQVLSSLEAQTVQPSRVIAVDNASLDGSVDIIQGASIVDDAVLLDTNLGVGAGHAIGIQTALRVAACELVWILEHDSWPKPTCLEELMVALSVLQAPGTRLGALSPRMYRVPGDPPARRASSNFKVNWSTFNGMLLTRRAVSEIGLPRADFFIGGEDFEYSRRLRDARYEIWRVPDALVEHCRAREFDEGRSYYAVRNRVFSQVRLSRPAWRRARAAAWALSGAARHAVRLDWRKAAARATGLFDGIVGRMGRRDYWFMGGAARK